jgi:hypothetical protein
MRGEETPRKKGEICLPAISNVFHNVLFALTYRDVVHNSVPGATAG